MLKPGYQSSEFIFAIFASALIGVFGFFTEFADSLGLPAFAVLLYKTLAPVLIAWMQNRYALYRTKLKEAELARQAAQPTP